MCKRGLTTSHARTAQATADPKLRLLMSSLAECVRTIAYKARALNAALRRALHARFFYLSRFYLAFTPR